MTGVDSVVRIVLGTTCLGLLTLLGEHCVFECVDAKVDLEFKTQTCANDPRHVLVTDRKNSTNVDHTSPLVFIACAQRQSFLRLLRCHSSLLWTLQPSTSEPWSMS